MQTCYAFSLSIGPKLHEWKTHSINYKENEKRSLYHERAKNIRQIHLRLHPHICEKKYLCIEGICEKVHTLFPYQITYVAEPLLDIIYPNLIRRDART